MALACTTLPSLLSSDNWFIDKRPSKSDSWSKLGIFSLSSMSSMKPSSASILTVWLDPASGARGMFNGVGAQEQGVE